jgi:hypothetical protein
VAPARGIKETGRTMMGETRLEEGPREWDTPADVRSRVRGDESSGRGVSRVLGLIRL